MTPKDLNAAAELKKILSNCVNVNGCLEWQGGYSSQLKPKPQQNYPTIYLAGKQWKGNRLVLMLSSGRFSETLFSLHKCDNKRCLNPKHLYWGTRVDNSMDMVSSGLHVQKRKTHCPAGHPYSGNNLYIAAGRNISGTNRQCKSCKWYRNRNLTPRKEIPKIFQDLK